MGPARPVTSGDLSNGRRCTWQTIGFGNLIGLHLCTAASLSIGQGEGLVRALLQYSL